MHLVGFITKELQIIHVPTCGQRCIIVMKIVVTTPHTLNINFHLLGKTPVSELSQTLLNEILKHNHSSSSNHNTSSITGLIIAGVGINRVIYLHATKVFVPFLSTLALVNEVYIRQERESFLNFEPHNATYICWQRENYLLINMVIYSLLKRRNMDILTEIKELCPVGWNVLAITFESESNWVKKKLQIA